MKVTKKSDFLREFARCIDMCEGTNVNPNDCYRSKSQDYFFGNNFNRNDFDTDDEFALEIVEDKPVFVDDILYNKENGSKLIAKEASYHNKSTGKTYTTLFIPNDVIENYSWNPQKPKTFNLNGVELPMPDAKVIRTGVGINIVDSCNNNISQCYSITFGGIEHNWSKQEDRDNVSNAITNLLSGK